MADIKKIAIIAPPVTTVPPAGQGGIETILKYKIDALVKMGHQVFLYAAGSTDLKNIHYIRVYEKSINERTLNSETTEASRKMRLETTFIVSVLQHLIQNQKDYDVVFNHTRVTELVTSLVVEKFGIPILNVFHLPILPEHIEVLKNNPECLSISISEDQIADCSDLSNFVGTVHNGIDPASYPPNFIPEDFFLWVGTIGPHKNPSDAIKVAKELDHKIYLMGKIRDQDYFDELIKPFIDNDKVIYLGELGHKEKLPYFQKAKVALFPTKIREACPVTPIEVAMCGTPVVAYSQGGTKELIKNGTNGFLVEKLEEMIEKTKEAININRKQCHLFAKENFSSEVMAQKYLDIYNKVKNEQT